MKRLAATVVTLIVLAATLAPPVLAADPAGPPHRPPSGDVTVTPLTGTTTAARKSESGRLAKSDAALLKRTDAAQVNILVKLDADSAATYAGDIDGLAPTSPRITGRSLRATDGAVRAYRAHFKREADAATKAIRAKVTGARVARAFDLAYGGLSVRLPARDAKKLLTVPGVAAVQMDELEHLATDRSPTFIGATKVWPRLGGSAKAGQGVIVGVLDSGIWPEHPSFADPGISHPGGTYACEFGDGTDPDLGPAFTCNDKLIGAYAFVDTYMEVEGALDGEFCDNATDECSARDAEGHGTHTASTAAGSPVASTTVLGIPRGAVSGIAPGAHVIAYRVCLQQGCFASDSLAGIEQAIVDGVDVINYSISGGATPYADPVELAFLDAYNAGIIVNASAGNEGPGPATASHAAPWVNTVGASSTDRQFLSTLHVAATGGDTLDIGGVTATAGISPTAVVLAGDIAGYADAFCVDPLPAGSASGVIVACQRGVNARVAKSFNVLRGGAAGMILYNPTPDDVDTDNHFVPAIHIDQPDTDALLAFLAGHAGVTASWAAGAATAVTGDVMADFSSRGPIGDFVKPDVTAPGMQILAGNTPEPATVDSGVPGELFQIIQGTSMSSPHAAGVAALVKAAHPSWTPGQIKSAMMTSSVQKVRKEDGTTPADPYDRGAGSIRADRAISPTVTFDVSAADYYDSAADALGRVDLNLPSIQQRDFVGYLSTTRRAKNVSGRSQTFTVRVKAPAGLRVAVRPSSFTLAAGASRNLRITLTGAELANGQYFAQITLDAKRAGANDAVLPIAIRKVDYAGVRFSHSCAPTTIRKGAASHCAVELQDMLAIPATATVKVAGGLPARLKVQHPSGASGIKRSGNGFTWTGSLAPAAAPTVESIDQFDAGGFFSLGEAGVPPIADASDESITEFDANIVFGHESYASVAMVSNGYALIGGGDAADVKFLPQEIPDPTRPNNVVAPLWTDLNPEEGGALRAAVVSGGGFSWIVLEWDAVPSWGAPGRTHTFQVWLGQNGVDDVSWSYDQVSGPFAAGEMIAGVENRDGASALTMTPADSTDWFVTMSAPTPGATVRIEYDAVGRVKGKHTLVGTMTSNVTVGTSVKKVAITVTK